MICSLLVKHLILFSTTSNNNNGACDHASTGARARSSGTHGTKQQAPLLCARGGRLLATVLL